MYPLLLSLHSVMRWVVVILAVLAVGRALYGWLGKQDWTELDERLGLFYTIALDVQLLLGIVLYIVSPFIRGILGNMGEAMGDTLLRFYAIEHVFMMVIAVILAHVGRALAKRAKDPAKKHRMAAIFFGLSFVVMLISIPWPFRTELGARPWINLGG